MSGFVNLHAEVMAMFADIYDAAVARYHEQLDLWTWARHVAYLEQRRDQNRLYNRTHRKVRSAAKQRWRDRYPDKARAQWRRSTAAYRARKKAALAAAGAAA